MLQTKLTGVHRNWSVSAEDAQKAKSWREKEKGKEKEKQVHRDTLANPRVTRSTDVQVDLLTQWDFQCLNSI